MSCNCKEIWVDVVGYENLYRISNKGNIFSKRYNRIMKPSKRNGYYKIQLYTKEKSLHESIHRLVAIHFLGNRTHENIVHHKDHNRLNNCSCNLEWSSQSENCKYAYKAKAREPIPCGENHHNSIYTEEFIKEIKITLRDTEYSYGIYASIARQFNIDDKTLSRIRHGKIWSHVKI